MREKLKKLMAVLMCTALLTAILPSVTLTAKAAKSPGITYSFANEYAGFAEGTITIETDESDSGTYYLYWADDSMAMNGYYEISKVKVSGGTGTYKFLENIAIPADATKIIAIKSDEEPLDKSVEHADFVYEIPAGKLNPHKSSEKTLSFEALSDTQLDLQSSVFYTYSLEHFAAALEAAAAREVDFVTTSGDCINNYQNGTSKEWQEFQKIIASSPYTNPIYEANGNHSMKSDIGYGIPAFETATGLNADNSELGDKPWYEITAPNGDHFLFLALETSSDVGGNDEFSMEQMNWLESKLQEYYTDNHHIFIFEHAFFHGWGPGDDKEQHYYAGGLRTTSDFPGNAKFRELMDTYTEVFLYTGHSHFDFEYNWNYDNEGGKTANLFHIPATACTTHVTNGKIDYSMDKNSSQCYIVDCYDDMVISNGLNVVDNMIYPAYTYIVSTKDYTHEPVEKPTEGEEESTEESSTMVDVWIENATSYLYDSGAALYFYNNDSGNVFPVNSQTGIAQIPENASNLTLYRCNGTWNSGLESKSDGVTSYWNKYGPVKREKGQTIFYVAGSSKFNWKEGTIPYPEETTEEETTEEETTEEETTEEEITKSYTETTVYWAIPKEYTESGYTYKMNIKCSDGTYPHSARTLSDTGMTYKGLEVYSYTFSAEYTEEYDTLGIQRIQMQGYSGSKALFQYAIEDKSYTISELGGKVFIDTINDAPASTKLTATESNFELFKEDVIEDTINIMVKDTTSSGWVYSSGAVVYLYDVDTGEHYEVTDEIAVIPKTAVNIVVYRCSAEWGGGNKTDSVTTYWNKWELAARAEENDAINLSGDGASVWTSSSDFEIDTDAKYYLVGYFDGSDYEGRDYEFNENGEVEIQFYGDSYVYVVSSANTSYWTNGWLGENLVSATLYKVTSLSEPDKLFVPSGKIKFKLTVNNDGTLTLSYECMPLELDKSELTLIDDESQLQTTHDVSTLEKIIDVTKSLLRTDYRYSSYVDYARLKKVYYTYKDLEISLLSESETQSIYNEFLSIYNNYLSMKEKNNVVTVYFCNDIGWSQVRAYIYNSETGKGINTLATAQGISAVKVLNCGVKIYCVTVNQSKWDKIIFTNGNGQQTIPLDVPTSNYVGFYFTDSDQNGTELVPKKFLYTFDSIDTYEALAYSMHDIVTDEKVNATVDTEGKTEGSHCTKCHLVIQAQKTIPAIGTVSLSEEEFIYDGISKTPQVLIKDSNGKELVEGVDYNITIPENTSEVGEYTVTIDFIGNYQGQITKTYIIKQAQTQEETTKEETDEKETTTVADGSEETTIKEDKNTTETEKSGENVKTGDSVVVIQYLLLLSVFSAGTVFVMRKGKKVNKR